MADFLDAVKESPEMEIPDCLEVWSVELPEAVTCMSSSESLVAAGTIEDTITIVDVATGEVACELSGHEGGVNSLQLTKDGQTLVSAGEDGKVRLWDVPGASCSHELFVDGQDPDRTPAGHTVGHVSVAPGDARFATAAGRSITLFTLPPGAGGRDGTPAREELPALPSTVEALRFRGRAPAADKADKGKEAGTADVKDEGTAAGKAAGGAGAPLLLATYHGGVSVWNLGRSAEEKQQLDLPYAGACLAGDVSDGMDWIVAGCHDSTAHIYHIIHEEGGVNVQEMTCGGYDSKVSLVEFDPGCGRLASSGGARCTVWDFEGGSPAGSVPAVTVGHSGTITAQAWQSAGASGLLATGGRDGRLFVYDLALAMPGEPRICLPVAMADTHEDEVTALAWAAGGRALLSGHVSGHVRCWGLPTLDEIEAGEDEPANQ